MKLLILIMLLTAVLLFPCKEAQSTVREVKPGIFVVSPDTKFGDKTWAEHERMSRHNQKKEEAQKKPLAQPGSVRRPRTPWEDLASEIMSNWKVGSEGSIFGKAVVVFSLNQDMEKSSIRLIQSSGSLKADQRALDAVNNTHPQYVLREILILPAEIEAAFEYRGSKGRAIYVKADEKFKRKEQEKSQNTAPAKGSTVKLEPVQPE